MEINLSDFVIYLLGASHDLEEKYFETGLMKYKTMWFHCIKKCDLALLNLRKEIK